MPFAFNAVELYVVTLNGKPWTRAKEVCKPLEYQKTSLQGEIRNARRTITDLIANRHVPRSETIDTVLVVVEKNDTKEHKRAKNFDKCMLRCQKSR